MARTQLITALTMAVVFAAAGPLPAQTAALSGTLDAGAVQLIEVRDGTGQAVLRGQFTDLGDERFAALGPATELDTDAVGEAEIDADEIEVSVRNLAPRARYTLAIDGIEVATMTTDAKGRGAFDVSRGTPRD